MGKAKRKPRPEMPRYFWLETDNCWRCTHRSGCNGCGFLSSYAKRYLPRKEKGGYDLGSKIHSAI